MYNIRNEPALQILREYVTKDNVFMAVKYALAAILFLQVVAPEFLSPFMEVFPTPWVHKWKEATGSARLFVAEVGAGWEPFVMHCLMHVLSSWDAQKYHGKGHPGTVSYVMEMGNVYEDIGKLDQAMDAFLTAAEISEVKQNTAGDDVFPAGTLLPVALI